MAEPGLFSFLFSFFLLFFSFSFSVSSVLFWSFPSLPLLLSHAENKETEEKREQRAKSEKDCEQERERSVQMKVSICASVGIKFAKFAAPCACVWDRQMHVPVCV